MHISELDNIYQRILPQILQKILNPPHRLNDLKAGNHK